MKVVLLAALFILLAASAFAFSGFPTDYPRNQYGHESTYYQGPGGEYRVYGAYGYFPQPHGYWPYGHSKYGYIYSPWDMRTGNTPAGFVTRTSTSRPY
jgi:hypothetical protein